MRIVDYLKDSKDIRIHRFIENGWEDRAVAMVQREKDWIKNISGDAFNLAFSQEKEYLEVQIPNDPLQKLIFTSSSYTGQDAVFMQNKNFQSALHLACEKGMLRLAKEIIKKSKDIDITGYVNWKDGYGRTSLHYACMSGNKELIEHLITVERSIQATDVRGMEPYLFGSVADG